MTFSVRQPFGAVDMSRLQSLSSVKNLQNAATPSFSSSFKNIKPTGKRSYSISSLDDENTENFDPSAFKSPTKRSKTDDSCSKSPQIHLFAVPQSVKPSPCVPSVRKALSSPVAAPTPISKSRGSLTHKRVGILSRRRVSNSPFKRIDPPTFSRNSSPTLPFSIDAALSGTIATYTPKSTPLTPAQVPSSLEESMPRSWFFDIHEDTPEQEATNLMEHSACVLDISSDDDSETRQKNEESERGKENIPPPGHFAPTRTSPQAPVSENVESADVTKQDSTTEHTKFPRLRNIAQDAMDEDRRPLSDLPAEEFYGPGLDATSYVTVDATLEKPSCLSKEFDFSVEETSKESVGEEPAIKEAVDEATAAPELICIYSDKAADALTPASEPIAIYADEAAVATSDISDTVQKGLQEGTEAAPVSSDA
ncbi:hypothetical protein GQ43DRAFT_462229 [Delitschia confertaspora ATCC 74209]|uniref:Thymidylate kinase n=1 Tax=Delitschia confertaspora ATCC 74209 TaxID=1513339 RepID=A0A9P4MTJ7_9PLEO|nr:hypothetical protein GQ43DRAFT_462229 [Delitschia confertaspora ATCC 74209]